MFEQLHSHESYVALDEERQKTLDSMWDAVHEIYHILTKHNLWSPEGTYTLRDGVVIYKGKDA